MDQFVKLTYLAPLQRGGAQWIKILCPKPDNENGNEKVKPSQAKKKKNCSMRRSTETINYAKYL